MIETRKDPLAGRSRAFRAALEAVEDMGRAEIPAATGRSERLGDADEDAAPDRCDPDKPAATSGPPAPGL